MSTTPRFYKQYGLLGDPSRFIAMLIERFGDFVHYRGLPNFYLINDPELVAQLFKQTQRKYDKNTLIYRRFRHALGNSLVNAEKEHWQRQRKLISPTFSPRCLRDYFTKMVEHTQLYLDSWEEVRQAGSEFDIAQEMKNLSLEIAGRALFSNSFENYAQEIHRLAKIISKFSARPPIPIIGHPTFPTPLTLKLNHSLRQFHDVMKQLILDRRDKPATGDLFSMFLSMRDEETGEPMSEVEVAEETLGMIVGSHESTATTLTWLLHELHQNPEHLMSVLHEIAEVVGSENIIEEHLEQLPYLQAVIYETLRLHPPFWFENRNAMQDVELGGVTIPKGSIVALSRYSLHRNPKYWESPDEFKPSRFIDGDTSIEELMRAGKYVPFSTGPRVCIGRHFALMEIKVVIVSILQRFTFKISPRHRDTIQTNLTMELKNGLIAHLTTQ